MKPEMTTRSSGDSLHTHKEGGQQVWLHAETDPVTDHARRLSQGGREGRERNGKEEAEDRGQGQGTGD